MISSRPPRAAEKRWHDWLRDRGCAICSMPASIHHAVGSTGKHNKVHIGQWWVLNLCHTHHQGPGGIHGDMSAFEFFDRAYLGDTRKEIERSVFEMNVGDYERLKGETIPEDVKNAIKSYRR